MDLDYKKELNEECGIFGVFNIEDASFLTYYGLLALQHRGQEASGIATFDGIEMKCIKNKGLLSDTFNPKLLKELKGNYAIGHVRYSTTAQKDVIEDIQPIMVRLQKEPFAISHNGSIINAQELKEELESNGSIFQGTSDSEVIGHLIHREKGSFDERLRKAVQKLDGAFTIIVMLEEAMYVVRDRYGFRPLSIAKLNGGYCVSSETCSFSVMGATDSFDVNAGEIIKITKDLKMETLKFTEETTEKMCAMEYIYFSRPDSSLNGINVHTARRKSGRILAEHDKKDKDFQADIVIGVPDSSLSAAIGYAEVSGVPYELGLIKNRYIGRTFIFPNQKQREQGVQTKLSAVCEIVQGKRIVLIDDSVVRGTTSKRIIKILKDAGAKEIHMRIASPPITHPCFYGVDMASRTELISGYRTVTEVKAEIKADSLKYLSVEDLKQAFGTDNLCFSCFTGKYLTKLYSKEKEVLENE